MTHALPLKRLYPLIILLLIEASWIWGLSLDEILPPFPSLETISPKLANWEMVGEEPLDAATQALLRPDLSIMRGYVNHKQNYRASLFIGYFKSTQPNHPGPHSPSVCLPGAGWKEIYAKESTLTIPSGSFPVNEYVLEKSTQRLVVLYWYQNLERAWANAVLAKLYMLPDFFAHRRSDVALVRLTTLSDAASQTAAMEGVRDLGRQVQPALGEAFAATMRPTQK